MTQPHSPIRFHRRVLKTQKTFFYATHAHSKNNFNIIQVVKENCRKEVLLECYIDSWKREPHHSKPSENISTFENVKILNIDEILHQNISVCIGTRLLPEYQVNIQWRQRFLHSPPHPDHPFGRPQSLTPNVQGVN